MHRVQAAEGRGSLAEGFPSRKVAEGRFDFIFPWESKTKQRMVFRMIHEKDSLLPIGKVWSLDWTSWVSEGHLDL